MTTDVVTQLWRELLYCLMLRTVRLSKQGTSIKIELRPSLCLFLFGYYNMPLHIWKTCSPYGFFWHRYAELATLSSPPPHPSSFFINSTVSLQFWYNLFFYYMWLPITSTGNQSNIDWQGRKVDSSLIGIKLYKLVR